MPRFEAYNVHDFRVLSPENMGRIDHWEKLPNGWESQEILIKESGTYQINTPFRPITNFKYTVVEGPHPFIAKVEVDNLLEDSLMFEVGRFRGPIVVKFEATGKPMSPDVIVID